jgi:hypothetical protein
MFINMIVSLLCGWDNIINMINKWRLKMKEMTLKKLQKSKKYRRRHTSWTKGYVSRKSEPVVYPYSGRFGEGYVVYSPSWRSTQYHYITYYIEK